MNKGESKHSPILSTHYPVIMKKNKPISSKLIKRLKIQGYCNLSEYHLSELAFGNRLAFIICSIVVFIGVAMANIPLLSVMGIIAFLGIVLPYHPFDYIYNHGLRIIMNKRKLLPRSSQIKFACTMATLWLASTITLFYMDYMIAGYIVGGVLFSSAFTVSITDICIPSLLYNFIFGIEV
jgi:hypothetical protein